MICAPDRNTSVRGRGRSVLCGTICLCFDSDSSSKNFTTCNFSNLAAATPDAMRAWSLLQHDHLCCITMQKLLILSARHMPATLTSLQERQNLESRMLVIMRVCCSLFVAHFTPFEGDGAVKLRFPLISTALMTHLTMPIVAASSQ